MAGTDLYDEIGTGYSLGRRTDPRWMSAIHTALGDARSVIDVGAGTGSDCAGGLGDYTCQRCGEEG